MTIFRVFPRKSRSRQRNELSIKQSNLFVHLFFLSPIFILNNILLFSHDLHKEGFKLLEVLFKHFLKLFVAQLKPYFWQIGSIWQGFCNFYLIFNKRQVVFVLQFKKPMVADVLFVFKLELLLLFNEFKLSGESSEQEFGPDEVNFGLVFKSRLIKTDSFCIRPGRFFVFYLRSFLYQQDLLMYLYLSCTSKSKSLCSILAIICDGSNCTLY